MALKGFRVQPTEDGDKVTVLAEDGDVRVITTIPRGVVDDVSPSELATPKEREDFIERNLGRVSGVIETKFRLGQFDSGGHDDSERFIRLEAVYLRGLNLQ
jgi:hypothetical protein